MAQRPSLSDLDAFAAVATHRSFRKAADVLSVTRSALSHAVANLERTVGVRLLNRTTRSVSLTDAGAAFLTRVTPVLRDFNEAIDSLADVGGAPSGALRINSNKGGARLLLETVIPAFAKRYPMVDVELLAEDRLVDIVEHGFDAGVRLSESVPQDMITVKLADEARFFPVASPAYLKKHGKPKVPSDLQHHVCIRHRFASGKRYRWEFSKRDEELTVDVPGWLTINDLDLMVQAAVDGLGIAYVPESAARGELAAKKLMPVLEDWCPPFPGLVLYYPSRQHMRPALRAFIATIRDTRRA